MKGVIVVWTVILTVCVIIGSILWPYTINTWLVFMGKPAVVVWWQGALLGFVPIIGQITIPAAVVTWLLMLVLV